MTTPWDGRSRPTPVYEPGALSPEEFETAFCEALVRTMIEQGLSSAIPPELDPAGARRYHGTYLKYMSFFAWKFPSWLMSVASMCPYSDVRKEIIKDCVDEEVGDVDADGMCHIDLLYDEAELCGISREEIFATEPPPAILSAIHAWENMTRTLGWLPAYAAIAGLEIVMSEPALKVRERIIGKEAIEKAQQDMGGVTFHQRLGMPEGSLKFFALHSYKDRFHGGGELAMLVKYAHTRALQEEAIWAVRNSMRIYAMHAHEVRRLAAEAAGTVHKYPMVS